MKDNKLLKVLYVCKYLYPLLICLYLFFRTKSPGLFFVQILEILFVFLVTQLAYLKDKRLAAFMNIFLMFFLNAGLTIMVFANSYLSMIMLSNITLIGDIGGKAGVYITGALLSVAFCGIPPRFISIDKRYLVCLFSGVFLLDIIVLDATSWDNSPLLSYPGLGASYISSQIRRNNISNMEISSEDIEGQMGLSGGYTESSEEEGDLESKTEGALSEERKGPSVITIFVEGLSQSVIDDSRMIMPNLKAFQEKSITFTNYFDHTIATYRALSGQLYSGHQDKNRDINPLPGIHTILKDNGYTTVFMNSEPGLSEFSEYLFGFDFDRLVEKTGEKSLEYAWYAVADGEMLSFIREEVKALEAENNPYYLATYTFGTHATLDSSEEYYGDGSNPELNKFYNFDYQFGKFLEWFESSEEISENTVLVLTADHATYRDDSWVNSFKDTQRTGLWVDTIPFSIYKKGITPAKIDVSGRNSLCYAPTVLDFIDVGEEDRNFFLGGSLFAEREPDAIDIFFYCSDGETCVSTEGGEIRWLEGEEKERLMERVNNYFAIRKSMQ